MGEIYKIEEINNFVEHNAMVNYKNFEEGRWWMFLLSSIGGNGDKMAVLSVVSTLFLWGGNICRTVGPFYFYLLYFLSHTSVCCGSILVNYLQIKTVRDTKEAGSPSEIEDVAAMEKRKLALEVQRKLEWKVLPDILDDLQLKLIQTPNDEIILKAEQRYLNRESFYSGSALGLSSFFLLLNPLARLPYKIFFPTTPIVTIFYIIERFNNNYSDFELTVTFLFGIIVPIFLNIITKNTVIPQRLPDLENKLNDLKKKILQTKHLDFNNQQKMK